MKEQGFLPQYIAEKLRTKRRTDIEALTEAVLIQLGVEYLFEHKVNRYFVDFALPKLGIALECDGWQHRTEKGRERDKVRDAVLIQNGWTVIHVPDKDIRADAFIAISRAIGLLNETDQ